MNDELQLMLASYYRQIETPVMCPECHGPKHAETKLCSGCMYKAVKKENPMSEETNTKLVEYRRTEKLVLQREARERAERIRIANGKGK